MTDRIEMRKALWRQESIERSNAQKLDAEAAGHQQYANQALLQATECRARANSFAESARELQRLDEHEKTRTTT